MPRVTRWKVDRRINRTILDLRCIRDLGEDCERSRPPVLVVAQSELYPWAQGLVWDFRNSPSACGTHLDYSAPLRSTLNADFFQQRLRTYPNQQLLSMIVEGVRYPTDVQLQGVCVPHLVSLPKGYASVRKELDRLERFGWYEYYSHLPFWPVYSNAQGATPRKLEQRWRRTTEGGGPRHELYDADNLRAWSLNNASRRLHVPRHFLADSRDERCLPVYELATCRPPPMTSRALRSIATPSGLGSECQQYTTLCVTLSSSVAPRTSSASRCIFDDDVKDYFNHLENAPEELWKSVITFLGDAWDVEARVRPSVGVEPDTIFVSERRMGFGLHPNANVAQQFSEALNDLLREDVDPVEDPILERDPRPSAQAWLAARRRLEA
jgi:hypothetical protein